MVGVSSLPLVFDAPKRGLPPKHFADLDEQGRIEAAAELGLPKFRANQLAKHYYGRLTADVQEMTDLPAGAREDVARTLFPTLMTPVRHISCDDDSTRKTLWRLHDGTLLESVLMRYPERNTLCISSQAGCGMACPFCATGQGGLKRNLSTGEIIAQVVDAARRLRDGEVPGGPGRVNNIVFMGMGEPMANYNAVLRAVRLITAPAPDGLGISARGVTVSTVGLVPQIRRLATEGIPVTLAVSLHAPDDELRDELCPINTRWGVRDVLDAAKGYFTATSRRVSIEYALIRDINDQAWRADRLADVLLGPNGYGWVHVNLIPLNPTPGSKWTASRERDEAEFVHRLEARGVAVTVRDTRGRDIDGACGQLAASEA